MSKPQYRIVRHDGGWAHHVKGTLSETFRTREEARKAARVAAREQQTLEASLTPRPK